MMRASKRGVWRLLGPGEKCSREALFLVFCLAIALQILFYESFRRLTCFGNRFLNKSRRRSLMASSANRESLSCQCTQKLRCTMPIYKWREKWLDFLIPGMSIFWGGTELWILKGENLAWKKA